MDPFAAALATLFYAPGSEEAFHTPFGDIERTDPIRVIRGQPDRQVGFGGQQIIQGTNVFEIRASDVANPIGDDIIRIGAERFKLLGDAMIDVEGITWTIGGSLTS